MQDINGKQPTAKEMVMIQQLTTIFTAIPFNRMLGLKLDHLDAEFPINRNAHEPPSGG